MINVEIVKMNKENYKAVAEIGKKCLKEAWSEKVCFEQLSNPNDFTYLAVCGGKYAGFLSVWLVAGEVEINNIAVLKEYRRMGIADKLLSEMEKEMCDAQSFYLEVRQSNKAAALLYEKHGFIQNGLRKNFYKEPTENAILMYKSGSNNR